MSIKTHYPRLCITHSFTVEVHIDRRVREKKMYTGRLKKMINATYQLIETGTYLSMATRHREATFCVKV